MRSRAAVVREVGGAWSVEEFELDPPRAGEVLVQMAAAGPCHSDEREGRLPVFGSRNPLADIPLLAGMYTAGQLCLNRRYPLDAINSAFDDLLRGELIRGVIDFGIA